MRGVLIRNRWFPALLGLGVSLTCSLHAAQPEPNQPPSKPAVAEETPAEPNAQPGGALTGMELIDAFSRKIDELEKFQQSRGLQSTDLQGRKSRAADELGRLIGALEMLMEQEAERMYEEAMKAEPAERDEVLKQLRANRYPQLQEVRSRAEDDLKQRTVGDTVYPTLEAAEQAREDVEEEQRKRQEAVEKKDLEDLEKLKQDLLTDPILQAARTFSEEEAGRMLERAMRLVLPQRREQLREIVRKYPMTKASTQAAGILSALDQQNEVVAAKKLHKALRSPVVFDQRWRRLKEIERDHPQTPAAAEARQIFLTHQAQTPPVTITNHTIGELKITADRPYSTMEELTLSAGESRTLSTAFPMMIRVEIGDNEWEFYRVWPGGNFILDAPAGIPVLCPAP